MEEKKKKKRKNLSDYKTMYSTESDLHLDMSLLPPKRKRKEVETKSAMRTSSSTCTSDQSHPAIKVIPKDPSDATFKDSACSTLNYDLPILEECEQYRQAVIDKDAFLALDENMSTFIILDYDSETKLLKNVPQLVARRRNTFTCMCDAERMAFVDNFSTSEIQDIDQLYKPCLHIEVVKQLHRALQSETLGESVEQPNPVIDHDYNMAKFKDGDEEEDKKSFEDGQIYELPFLENHFVVYAQCSYSVVKVVFGKMKCLFCTGKNDCKHLQFLNKLLLQYEHFDLPEVLDKIHYKLEDYNKKIQYELKCHSYQKIPFKLEGAMQEQIHKDVEHTLPKDENNRLKAVTNETDCPTCGHRLLPDVLEESIACTLISRYRCLHVTCYKKLCSNKTCKAQIPYDGREDCILNMGSVLVHYDVLRDFMFQYLYSRVTMFSFYNVLAQHQKDAGNTDFPKKYPYSYFRHTWYSFLSRLDINYQPGFICNDPDCGLQPKTVLFDGTSLSFQKQFHYDLSSLTDWKQERLKGSRHKDRVFIKDKTTRDMILSFCKKDAMFQQTDFVKMKNRLKIHQEALDGFFVHLEDIGCNQSCPDEYRDFIRMLSCNSPVCAAFPFDQLDNIRFIIDNKNFRENLLLMKRIQSAVPILFELICAVPDLPQFIRNILSAVVEITTKTFMMEEHETSSEVTQDALAYFPNLPKIRCRGLYVMDKKIDEKVCTKKGSRHPSLLPGIFTVFCPHGICYGFEVMDSVESPDRPFTFLKTRFKDPPTSVIYDNACNLQQYCLNRDPGFFRKTRFYVDGLHWDCHGCAVSYKGLLYPEIQNINTQMVEQNNAKLKKLKPSLSYMKADNFMKSVTFFEWHCNQQLKD